MTSRRSRLKAVTNLPVRRKVLTVQGNTTETASIDNFTTEKVFSCDPKSQEILATAYKPHPNSVAEKNLNDVTLKNKGKDPVLKVNFAGLQRNDYFTNENDVNNISELDNSDVVENNNDLSKTSTLFNFKTDSNNEAVFKNDHHFKLNSVSSSLGRETQIQTLENKKENEILLQQSCSINYNNSNNNSIINNIVEDGFKCYTVLTPQNVSLGSLAEYTLTPLASCPEHYIETSLSNVTAHQEFEEIQIYAEAEPAELYINNNIDDNNEPVLETEPLEPVLTSLTNLNSEHEMGCINYKSANSNIIELKNNSENLIAKPTKKNGAVNGKTNFIKKNEQYKSLFTQIKDSNVLERTISSSSLKVSPDFHLFKQNSTVKRKRVKYNDYTKKLADAKREFQRKYEKTKPDRSSLKMIDLIFYNPSSNPMESKTKFEKKDTLEPTSELVNDLLIEEKVDEPEILDSNSRSNMSDNGEESASKMPVPQVKIGLDGEIILDEKSLIIETTDAKKGREGLQNSLPVLEDKGCKISYYRGKSKKTRDWADFETKRFYKALNTIGPDFTLMQKYFPKRSRLELKNKFKREERLNRALIDKALNNPSEFDMTQLEKDLAVEKEAEEGMESRYCRLVKQTVKKPKIKSSLLSREIMGSDGEPEKNQLKSLDLDTKKFSERERSKKEKEFDFVFHKLLMKESEKSGAVLPEISLLSNTIKGSDQGVT